ncbi:hypothetical protein K488DRAFT_50178 [Vararia minispora EC-137]|uniref:Uncharacterized protein n=1 Tax=Vararia minispora EC-137 TaxID=1314806 RepID=A0ACB8QKT0_9AGAM|nr:hypothetical protein K488DRAFT_50178 [Vararia minispora EC-137]
MSAANGASQPSGGPNAGPVAAGPGPAGSAATSNSPNSGTGSTSGGGADLRRVKSGLSCAECRRSKLKCDRSFPCQSCIRRGCAAICPDGVSAPFPPTRSASRSSWLLHRNLDRNEG